MSIKNSILAFFLILLTSCGGNTMPAESPQEQIDSIANVKITTARVRMQKQNDSVINALAHEKADSAIKTIHNEAARDALPPKPASDRPVINKPDSIKKPVIK